jgi:hypothetical protein
MPDYFKKVNFFVVGAGKTGTTWLHSIIKKHPDIHLSHIKEMDYFSKYFDYGEDWYHKLFKEESSDKIKGDISPNYMVYESCPKRIFQYNPHAKIIFILRDPVERACSHYYMVLRSGLVSREIDNEIVPGSIFVDSGLYYKHLSRYLQYFHEDQIGIFFYDDLKKDPKKFLIDFYKFIFIKNYYLPEEIYKKYHKKRAIPKNITLYNAIVWAISFLSKNIFFENLITKVRKSQLTDIFHKAIASNMEFPVLSSNFKEELLRYYYHDIQSISSYTEKDLSAWLKKS